KKQLINPDPKPSGDEFTSSSENACGNLVPGVWISISLFVLSRLAACVSRRFPFHLFADGCSRSCGLPVGWSDSGSREDEHFRPGAHPWSCHCCCGFRYFCGAV